MKRINTKPKLSKNLYGALKLIAEGGVTVDLLPRYRDTTLYWVFKHGWARRSGKHVLLTSAGYEALEAYNTAAMPEREHVRPVTSRTAEAIHYIVRVMKRNRRSARALALGRVAGESSK